MQPINTRDRFKIRLNIIMIKVGCLHCLPIKVDERPLRNGTHMCWILPCFDRRIIRCCKSDRSSWHQASIDFFHKANESVLTARQRHRNMLNEVFTIKLIDFFICERPRKHHQIMHLIGLLSGNFIDTDKTFLLSLSTGKINANQIHIIDSSAKITISFDHLSRSSKFCFRFQ